MTNPVRAAAFLIAALAAAPAFAVSLRMEASTTWTENISSSGFLADQTDALRNEARLSASHLQPLVTGLNLVAEADAALETVPRYLRNTIHSAGATVQLRKKFGLGAFAPLITAEVALHHRNARLTGASGWRSAAALRFSQRFTPAWRASLTGDWQENDAPHKTFDVRHHRMLGALTWDVTQRWQLTYGRGSLWGNILSNFSPSTYSRIRARLISSGTSHEVTDSYGPGWVTNRANVRSDFWWLDLAPALGPNTSLPMRYESFYIVSRSGTIYRQSSWTLSLLHRF